VALIKRASEEEKAAKAERKAIEADEKARADATKARQKLKDDFFASPPGRARNAFERGDHVFQYSIDVQKTEPIVIAMTGAFTKTKATNDPSEILNAVCNEGWELVNGSFVFLELGSESRDKFMASGQNVAVKGTIVGYYLFKRCEANRQQAIDPWDVEPEAGQPGPGPAS
jgi:hypothetical protein